MSKHTKPKVIEVITLLAIIAAIILVLSARVRVNSAAYEDNTNTQDTQVIHATSAAFYDEMASHLTRHDASFQLSVSNSVGIPPNVNILTLFKTEHPRGLLGWLVSSGSRSETRYTSHTTYKFRNLKYRSTAQSYNDALAAADSVVAAMKLSGMNDFDRVDAIYSYMKKNWTYDVSSQFNTAYDVFQSGKGVCWSFSMAQQMLYDAAGLESASVLGTRRSDGVAHVWLIVNLGGNWYVADSTNLKGEAADYLYNSYTRDYTLNSAYDVASLLKKYPLSPVTGTEISKLPEHTRALFREGVIPAEFLGSSKVTREMYVTMLVNLIERETGEISIASSKASTDALFTDISACKYADKIVKASVVGITKGIGNGEFAPNQLISDSGMVTMAHRAADWLDSTAMTSVIPNARSSQASTVNLEAAARVLSELSFIDTELSI
jgi:hypothetical protein